MTIPRPTEIVVLGHSYNEIDQDYFLMLNEYFKDIPWRFSFHDDSTQKRLTSMLAKMKNYPIALEQFLY